MSCPGQTTRKVTIDSHERSLDELARATQLGDDEAFELVATRLRPRLLAALSKRLDGGVADAEDVVQDALTRVWRRIDAYDADRSFVAWVYTIAFRTACDHTRKKRREREHVKRATLHASSQSRAEKTVIDRETVDDIWAAARRGLSDTQYIALWLRYAEGLAIGEIAQAMGKTQGAVRVALHRARAKLHSLCVEESRS